MVKFQLPLNERISLAIRILFNATIHDQRQSLYGAITNSDVLRHADRVASRAEYAERTVQRLINILEQNKIEYKHALRE